MESILALLTLNTLSGVVGFLTTFSFGIWLLQQPNSKNMNVTSWVMWALMDGILVMLALKSGNHEPYLFIGWTLAATLVVVGILVKGASWEMDFGSWVCVITVGASAYFWATNASGLGLYACAVAMFVAGIPQIKNFLKAPAKETWWLWTGTAVAGVMSVAASEHALSVDNAPTISSALYQLVVLAILFRR